MCDSCCFQRGDSLFKSPPPREAFGQEPVALGVRGEADGDATLGVALDVGPMRGGDVLVKGWVDVETFPVQ